MRILDLSRVVKESRKDFAMRGVGEGTALITRWVECRLSRESEWDGFRGLARRLRKDAGRGASGSKSGKGGDLMLNGTEDAG